MAFDVAGAQDAELRASIRVSVVSRYGLLVMAPVSAALAERPPLVGCSGSQDKGNDRALIATRDSQAVMHDYTYADEKFRFRRSKSGDNDAVRQRSIQSRR